MENDKLFKEVDKVSEVIISQPEEVLLPLQPLNEDQTIAQLEIAAPPIPPEEPTQKSSRKNVKEFAKNSEGIIAEEKFKKVVSWYETVISFGWAFMPTFTIVLFALVVVGAMRSYKNSGYYVDISPAWEPIKFSAIGISDQLLALIPVILSVCFLMIGLASYALKKIKPRQVDWTDSNLLLEYTGSYSLAVKWASIAAVTQIREWDPLNGKQPVFIVKNKQGLEFKIRLSDLVRQKDVRTFFSMIKANAPQAEIIVDKEFQNDNTYTELWLRYFSMPTNRTNKGSMENGTVLDEGRYTILGTLGGGGQGTALRAKYEPARGKAVSENHILKPNFELLALNPDVVIKEYVLPVHRGQLTAQKTAEKLKAEAEILGKIDNPQVVKILDCFVEDYRGFLVLEYVQGDTLQSLVNRLGPQPEDQVVDWALQVCSVLSYLHHLEPPIVHRDITPDNLMLDQNEKIKVVDFNVAYQVDSSATATVVGKHAYIPAEQFRGKPVPQSDIYALGGTLNFLLTGLDPEPITRSHPKIIRPEISQALDDIVAKATSTDLSKRYSDVELLAKDLSGLIAQNR